MKMPEIFMKCKKVYTMEICYIFVIACLYLPLNNCTINSLGNGFLKLAQRSCNGNAKVH